MLRILSGMTLYLKFALSVFSALFRIPAFSGTGSKRTQNLSKVLVCEPYDPGSMGETKTKVIVVLLRE
jgi:hypothetical protein